MLTSKCVSVLLWVLSFTLGATWAEEKVAEAPVKNSEGAAQPAGSDLKTVLDNLKPGEWYEVPDSHLETIAAPKSQFPWLTGSSGLAGIISCWAGGAFDSQRDQLYIGPGGGHNGYNGNEVYAFRLSDLKWHRLTDPYPIIKGESTDPKLAPFAMHTYDGVEYLPPPTDRYVVVGGWDTPDTYALNPDQPEHWEVYPSHGTGRTGDISAYDPVRHVLWFATPSTGGMLTQWEPLKHEWTLRSRSMMDSMEYHTTGDIDFKHNVFVAVGAKKVFITQLASIPEVVTSAKITTTGDSEIINNPSPGFCYAPLLNQFVAWGSGADVYTLDMETKAWTKHPPAATNKVIPGKPDQWGTFGRFRYVASQNIFILYNSVKQNVFLYRLTADKPNIITAVKATPVKPSVDTNIPTTALTVEAVYADGTRKNVTDQANYFSLDPSIAQVDLHGKGVVTGLTSGTAKIRVVYTDSNFKRGFEDTVSITVKDIIETSTLEAVKLSYSKITVVTGDSFQLIASGNYTHGGDRFSRDCTAQAEWKSDAPDIATVAGGLIKAVGKTGTAKITTTFKGKSDTAEVTISETPVITRINFQVKDTSPRPGWEADNGKAYSDARGFGWLTTNNFSTRDDRVGTKNFLLKSFVNASEPHDFKVKVPEGSYVVRIAMGDPQYGAVPFACWTALGTEKLIYFTGRANDIATRIVKAGSDGLTFTCVGSINYLIVAPIGIDLDRYANDGPD